MKYLLYSIGAMVCWGFWGFFPRLAVSSLDFSSAQVWNWIGGTFILLPSACYFGAKFGGNNPSYYYAMLAGISGSIGGLLYNKGLSICEGHSATVIAVSALYPVVSIALTFIFLRERLNVWQIVGIVLCIVGATVLGLSSRMERADEQSPSLSAAEVVRVSPNNL
jgi:transporter family protein